MPNWKCNSKTPGLHIKSHAPIKSAQGYRPSPAERALAGLREELAAYLLRCEQERQRRWGYKALRELCNLSSLLDSPAPRPVSAGLCIGGMADAAVILAAAAGYGLRARLDSAPLQPVLLDAAALRTGLFNLIGNACRYAPDRRAELRVTYGPSRCRIRIENKAAGYPRAGLGLMAASAAAGRLSGGFRLLFCEDRLTAALDFPLPAAPPVESLPSCGLAGYLGDPFSPAYVGLADLGYIPGCTGQ